MRAIIPEVEAPVLATFSNPLVEFTLAFEVDKLKMFPVVSAFAAIVIGVEVVIVDQFQVCAKFKLLIELAAVAAVKADKLPPPPPVLSELGDQAEPVHLRTCPEVAP